MFDSNALNGPKMTQDQLARYLDRIRLAGPVPLTLAGLTEVQQAHRLAVNFENLDLMMGRPVSLDLEHLYDKIVVRRQEACVPNSIRSITGSFTPWGFR